VIPAPAAMVRVSLVINGATALGAVEQEAAAAPPKMNCMMLLSMPRFFDQVQERRERHPCSCFLNEVFGL
jgi:hypothetical protein